MDEIVQEQFTVAPRFGANQNGVAEYDATLVLRDNASAPGGLRQLAALRQRDSPDDQHAHALAIPNPSQAGIGQVLRVKGNSVGQNEFFLLFGPLISKGQKLFEGFLVDHGDGGD